VQSWRRSSPEAILKQIMESALGGDRGSNMNVTCRDCHVRQHPLCTDGKVQGRTLDRVALELRGRRTLQVGGKAVRRQCDRYSLYVQLSQSRSLEGIMLLSKVRARDVMGNTVAANMVAAERLVGWILH
jgi:hypothetical protein